MIDKIVQFIRRQGEVESRCEAWVSGEIACTTGPDVGMLGSFVPDGERKAKEYAESKGYVRQWELRPVDALYFVLPNNDFAVPFEIEIFSGTRVFIFGHEYFHEFTGSDALTLAIEFVEKKGYVKTDPPAYPTPEELESAESGPITNYSSGDPHVS
jgi:hypothetical protein